MSMDKNLKTTFALIESYPSILCIFWEIHSRTKYYQQHFKTGMIRPKPRNTASRNWNSLEFKREEQVKNEIAHTHFFYGTQMRASMFC